jgi:hypothetical protein
MEDKNKNALSDVIGSFIGDYAERDKAVIFADWLAERLQKEMSSLSAEQAQSLCADIIASVGEFDKTLEDLNKAIEAGQSKEEWLAERLIVATEEMSHEDAGNALTLIEQGLDDSNNQLMQNIGEEVVDTKISKVVDWNKYSVKAKILEIGQQVLLNGMAATASAVKQNIEGEETVSASDVIKTALLSGEDVDRGEVKSVVAGAIQAAAGLGLDDTLPADVSIKLTGDIAGVAVETAGALVDLASGKITMLESQNIIGRASIVGSCRMFGTILKSVVSPVSLIPVVGKQLSCAIEGLIDTSSEKVASFVFDTAVLLREGLNKVGNKVKSGVKKLANKIFS